MSDFTEVAGRLIRAIEDWPEPGVTFRDITPLLADAEGLSATVTALVDAARAFGPLDAVAGIEARGFLLAPLVAEALKIGLVPVRKAGKLPAATLAESYSLEYGEATVEIHADAVPAGSRVLLLDDVLATGGTLRASARLFEHAGAEVAGALVLIELPALGGRSLLTDVPLTALLEY
ncbi:adenine phosphoribosyltransferase [Aeromicrobium sp.]|uniref:adenine phosphoribosyltransferase n=1 Tax=Aeromicrobium sp. TaxID=1871063 RepID=UPI0028AA996F|nr:adenine phosphoribosyltransferase [Aeromicrobium sp.]